MLYIAYIVYTRNGGLFMKRLTKELFHNYLLEKKDFQLTQYVYQGSYVLEVKHYDAVCVIRFAFVSTAHGHPDLDWNCKFNFSHSLESVDFMRWASYIYSFVYSKTKGWFHLDN